VSGSGWGSEKVTGMKSEEGMKQQQKRRKEETEGAILVTQDLLVVREIHIVQLELVGKRWETNPTGRE